MTNDYIRRQDAVDAFNRIKNTLKNPETAHYDTLMFYEIEDVLEDVEPADVAPVVHARWKKSDSYIDRYDETIEILICKSCGFKHHYCQGDTSMSDDGWFHFCPNCGAKMDGERKEKYDG